MARKCLFFLFAVRLGIGIGIGIGLGVGLNFWVGKADLSLGRLDVRLGLGLRFGVHLDNPNKHVLLHDVPRAVIKLHEDIFASGREWSLVRNLKVHVVTFQP